MQLDDNLQTITTKYCLYVSSIRECLQAKGVHPKDLCSDLMALTAFNHTKQKRCLLSAHETELQKATDLNGIFNLLVKEYASFLNYEVFQFILDKYHIDNGQEEFQYPRHLVAYINSHKISEFIEINPLLKDFTDASKEVVLKIDIESTSELAKLERLRTAVAKILRLKAAALRLLDVEEGCVVVRFLIPTPVAELIFSKHSVLTEEQVDEFRALHVLWLECNDRMFDFTTEYLKYNAHKNQEGVLDFTTKSCDHKVEHARVAGFTKYDCSDHKQVDDFTAADLKYANLYQKQVDDDFTAKDVKYADLYHDHMVFSRYDNC